ncbi:MAG: hypothetical protein F4Z77_13440 [Dehalococcoidia bacterium]|nr:hypothetical protein [Dehalococcoidia bacterium]MYA54346.1 hypothetical protein [Dehalococcoidia bacterium]
MRVPDDRTPKRRAFDRVSAYLNNHRYRLALYEDRPKWHHVWDVWDTWHEDEGAIAAFAALRDERGSESYGDWATYGLTNLMIKGLMVSLVRQGDVTGYLYRHVFAHDRYSLWDREDCPGIVKTVRNRVVHYNEGLSSVIFWPDTTLDSVTFKVEGIGKEAFDIPSLVSNQGEWLTEVLNGIADRLQAEEQEHRDSFAGESLLETVSSLSYPLQQVAIRDDFLLFPSLDEIAESVVRFQEGAEARGYKRGSEYDELTERLYEDIEVTLGELRGGGGLGRVQWDQKAEFLKSRVKELQEFGESVDEEFAQPASKLER